MSSILMNLDLSTYSLFNLNNKVALVTEGCSRAGITVVSALLQNGAKVYVVCESDGAVQVVKELLGEQDRCQYLIHDLRSKEGCLLLSNSVKELEPELHILVNNSGATWGGKWEEFPDEGWDQAMASHVKSLLYVTGCFTGLLAKNAVFSDPGRIVNIPVLATGDTDHLDEEKLNLSYDTSKSAVSHLTAVLSTSLASKHISVNAILPDIEMARVSSEAGATISEALGVTEHVNFARDLAGILVFLVSSGGARITGARIEAEHVGHGTTNRWWGRKRLCT